ncbi:MAG: 2-oxoglutarate:acceptor oxidoreductase [Clostridiales bacterium]|nr:2-oxoglutarate:acceptor oxidoreductase [Clostridiales bacterium]
MKYQIRYGAIGGQGIITAGSLLADIAVEMEDKYAVCSPTYSAVVRGGPTKVDVMVSDEPILFPHATSIDFCICTDQRPFDLYYNRLKDDAILVVDSHLVTNLGNTKNWQIYSIPLINETKRQAGNIVLTSIVSLAITQKLTGIIKYDNMVEFIKGWAPKNALDMNLKAVDVAQELIEKYGKVK